jgi:hypothetical protein
LPHQFLRFIIIIIIFIGGGGGDDGGGGGGSAGGVVGGRTLIFSVSSLARIRDSLYLTKQTKLKFGSSSFQ